MNNNSNPFFSVIVPTYNRAFIIDRCINSILAQEYVSFEIIVVDDGSTDNTKEVVCQYMDSRINYFFQENRGVSVARNEGSKLAKGDYLVFLDSDDYVNDIWLKDFFTVLQHNLTDVVICRSKTTEDFKNDSSSFLAGTFAINKNVFYDIGMYDKKLKFGENTELNWRINFNNCRIETIENSNIIYDVTYSEGRSNSQNKVDFFYYVIEKHKEIIQKKRKWAQLLYQIAGVNCFQLGRKKEGRKLIWLGYFKKPLHMKSFGRAIYYSFKK
jgi:glycosyltransferase involved in cell wall biosynthesis